MPPYLLPVEPDLPLLTIGKLSFARSKGPRGDLHECRNTDARCSLVSGVKLQLAPSPDVHTDHIITVAHAFKTHLDCLMTTHTCALTLVHVTRSQHRSSANMVPAVTVGHATHLHAATCSLRRTSAHGCYKHEAARQSCKRPPDTAARLPVNYLAPPDSIPLTTDHCSDIHLG